MANDSNSPAPPQTRLVYRFKPGPWTLTIEGARAFGDAIGVDLLAAFLKCFQGIDRVYTFEQLLDFNYRMLPEGNVARDRNMRVLILTLGSTVYELGKALQELCNQKVVKSMSDRGAWAPVNEFRGKLQGDASLAKLRNQLGFHLGDLDLYRSGLPEVLSRGDTVTFEVGSGMRRHDGDVVFAFDVLMAGLGFEDTDFEAVTDLAQRAHTELPDLLHAVFQEVINTAGIEVHRES